MSNNVINIDFKPSEYTIDERYSLGTAEILIPPQTQIGLYNRLASEHMAEGDFGEARTCVLLDTMSDVLAGIVFRGDSLTSMCVRSLDKDEKARSIYLSLAKMENIKKATEAGRAIADAQIEVGFHETELAEEVYNETSTHEYDIPTFDMSDNRTHTSCQINHIARNIMGLVEANGGRVHVSEKDRNLLVTLPYNETYVVAAILKVGDGCTVTKSKGAAI